MWHKCWAFVFVCHHVYVYSLRHHAKAAEGSCWKRNTDTSPTDSSPNGHFVEREFAEWTVRPQTVRRKNSSSTDSSPNGQIVDRQFAERTVLQQTVRWMDSSLTGQFADSTARRQYSSPTGQFTDRIISLQDSSVTGLIADKTVRRRDTSPTIQKKRETVATIFNWQQAYYVCENIFL